MQEKRSELVLPDGQSADTLLNESPVETEMSREFKGKKDFINEIAERIFLPEHESLLDTVIEKIMKKGNVDITMEKYVERNFGFLIRHFPDLQELHLEIARSRITTSKRNRRKRKKK